MPAFCPPDRQRWLRWMLALALTGSVSLAGARHPDLELDDLSDAEIDQLLQAELDDEDLAACGLNPRARITVEDMQAIVMCALGDDRDDDDEDDVDFDDLEAEMEEAGRTLEDVVQEALVRADALAHAPPSGPAADRPDAAPAALADSPESAPADALAVRQYALRNGFIDPGRAAVPPVKQGVRFVIRSRR